MILRTLFVTCLFISFALPASANDRVRPRDALVTYIKNGQPLMIPKEDQKDFLNRLVVLFNSNTADTSEAWLRYEFEKGGKTLPELWDYYKQGNAFSVVFDQNAKDFGKPIEDEEEKAKEDKKKKSDTPPAEKKKKKRAVIEEFIVTVNTDPQRPMFGHVLAQLKSGEIRAYNVENIELVGIYCLDKAQRFLPAHYHILAEKYSTQEFVDQSIYCKTK